MGKTAIFYDSHIEKRGNTIKEASEKWDVKQSDTFPLISMTKEKLKNYQKCFIKICRKLNNKIWKRM